MNIKDNFYAKLGADPICKNDGLELILNNDSGFFEVCQKFLDIALNALKIRTKDGDFAGIFQYSDIDIAKGATIEFARKRGIKDIKSLLSIIETVYDDAKYENEKRQTSGFDRNTNISEMPVGYAGTLYFFTRIADDVFDKIKSQIISEYNSSNNCLI